MGYWLMNSQSKIHLVCNSCGKRVEKNLPAPAPLHIEVPEGWRVYRNRVIWCKRCEERDPSIAPSSNRIELMQP